MLTELGANPAAAHRSALADYLALKATNDQIRERAVRWLFDVLVELASIANRRNMPITVEREDSHRFSHRGATLAGSVLRLRHGVRCLTLEAGWTRVPGDGFMRGQALAMARISHFGLKRADTEMSLRHTDNLPNWFVLDKNNSVTPLTPEELMRHFSILVDR